MTGCWVVEQGLAAAGSCDGRIVAAHLIPKQRIKRQFPHGAKKAGGENVWRPVARGEVMDGPFMYLPLTWIVWSERVVVPMCGGPTGVGGHHGALDYARSIRIPRALLPAGVEEFAVEYGLEWSLERDYGPKER